MGNDAAQHALLTSEPELRHSASRLLHPHKGPPMTSSEVRPQSMTALCAALTAVLRLPETGETGRAASQSPAEVARLAA